MASPAHWADPARLGRLPRRAPSPRPPLPDACATRGAGGRQQLEASEAADAADALDRPRCSFCRLHHCGRHRHCRCRLPCAPLSPAAGQPLMRRDRRYRSRCRRRRFVFAATATASTASISPASRRRRCHRHRPPLRRPLIALAAALLPRSPLAAAPVPRYRRRRDRRPDRRGTAARGRRRPRHSRPQHHPRRPRRRRRRRARECAGGTPGRGVRQGGLSIGTRAYFGVKKLRYLGVLTKAWTRVD